MEFIVKSSQCSWTERCRQLLIVEESETHKEHSKNYDFIANLQFSQLADQKEVLCTESELSSHLINAAERMRCLKSALASKGKLS